MPGRKGSKLLALILVGIVLGVTSYFVLSEPEPRYSLNVDQVWEKTELALDRDLRLQGVLVPGTLKPRASGCGFDFALQRHPSAARKVLVHYDACGLPDTACDLPPSEPPRTDDYFISFHVDGELERRGRELHLRASRVMATCPPYYWYPADGGPISLCRRHRPGFFCPMCEHAGSVPHGIVR